MLYISETESFRYTSNSKKLEGTKEQELKTQEVSENEQSNNRNNL